MIWVWSVGGPSDGVTVTARVAAARHVRIAKFTVCPKAGAATCVLGRLPAGQADELQAASSVQKAATGSEHVTLTVTATGKNALTGRANRSLTVTAPPAKRTPGPPGGVVVPTPRMSLQPLPVLTEPPGIVGNPAGLFPTVEPIPSVTPPIAFPPARSLPGRSRAETASAIVPLDPKLIGGQLAGLAVLAAAITIAIARISLRRVQPQDGTMKKRTES
ncbi:MAG: hypothetical protein ACRDNZ_08290 [Streptosporangiaceae bacterium]